MRAASFQQVVESFSEVSLSAFRDPAIAELLNRVMAGGEISEEESGRLSFFFPTFFRRAESMYFHSESGTLEKETWVGIEGTLRSLMETREGQSWWSGIQYRFNPRFTRYVNDRLVPKTTSP